MVVGIEAAHANKRERTGVEEYCFQIIQELKKTVPADVRVVLYSNEPLRDGLEVLPKNWEIKVLSWPLKKLWSQTRLAFELLMHPPDVFFAPGQLLPWCVPKKSVVTVHDSAFLAFPGAFNFLGRQYLKLMQWWIVRKASKIIVPSRFSQQELKRFYPELALEKMTVIPHGFNEAAYSVQAVDGSIPEKYGITKPYLISIGRLEEKKNTLRVIEAFNLLKQRHDVQLVLVGKLRVGQEAILKALKDSPYKEDIFMPGFVLNADAAQLLVQAYVCVFPSLHEGFGLPVLEAMAAGCPVVTSSQTALPEVGGEAVLYVDPHDTEAIANQIVQILNNKKLREELVQKGFDRVKEFSWKKAGEVTANSIVNQW